MHTALQSTNPAWQVVAQMPPWQAVPRPQAVPGDPLSPVPQAPEAPQ
jgi:hypothetical protein